MEINDLSIGDLVLLHDKPVTVRGILDTGEVYFGDDFYFTKDRYVNARVLEPIKLTDDMLLANGYTKILSDDHFFKLDLPSIHKDSIENSIYLVHFDSIPIKLTYVHELQHILSFFNKELANNFKLINTEDNNEEKIEYVPYDCAKEFYDDLRKNGMFLVHKDSHEYYIPSFFDDYDIRFVTNTLRYGYNDILTYFKWDNGLPCGKLKK